MTKIVFYGSSAHAFSSLQGALRLRWPEQRVSRVTPEPTSLTAILHEDPDLVVVGPILLTEAGPVVVRSVRDRFSGGIIAFSKEPSETELLEVIDAGADDYLPADASIAQVVARVSAVLRRVGAGDAQSDTVTTCGSLHIDSERHQASVGPHEMYLTPTEFKLLHHLAQNGGKVVTQAALHRLIWGCEGNIYLHSLRKYVERLRKRLAESDAEIRIISVPRVGYKLTWPSG